MDLRSTKGEMWGSEIPPEAHTVFLMLPLLVLTVPIKQIGKQKPHLPITQSKSARKIGLLEGQPHVLSPVTRSHGICYSLGSVLQRSGVAQRVYGSGRHRKGTFGPYFCCF